MVVTYAKIDNNGLELGRAGGGQDHNGAKFILYSRAFAKVFFGEMKFASSNFLSNEDLSNSYES